MRVDGFKYDKEKGIIDAQEGEDEFTLPGWENLGEDTEELDESEEEETIESRSSTISGKRKSQYEDNGSIVTADFAKHPKNPKKDQTMEVEEEEEEEEEEEKESNEGDSHGRLRNNCNRY